MMEFYREKNGDYMVIDTDTWDYYQQIGRPRMFEGRATAISGLVGSVQTTAIDQFYLAECKAVDPDRIPAEWLNALIGEPER